MLDLEKLGLIPPQNAKIVLLYYSRKKALNKRFGGLGKSLRSWQLQIDIKTRMMILLIAQT